MALRRNGGGVAPERGCRFADVEEESKFRQAAKGSPNVPPKASHISPSNKAAKEAMEKAVRLCPRAEPAKPSGEALA